MPGNTVRFIVRNTEVDVVVALWIFKWIFVDTQANQRCEVYFIAGIGGIVAGSIYPYFRF